MSMNWVRTVGFFRLDVGDFSAAYHYHLGAIWGPFWVIFGSNVDMFFGCLFDPVSD